MSTLTEDVHRRAHMALAEVGMTYYLKNVKEPEDDTGAPVIGMSRHTPDDIAWRTRALANGCNKPPACFACAVVRIRQAKLGVPVRDRWPGCESFGRFPLRDCGVPRPEAP